MSEELPELPEPAGPDVGWYTDDQMRDYARSYARQAVLAERERHAEDAERYRWLRDNVPARVALAVEVFGYEKMDCPPAEWLDKAVSAAIRKGAEDRLAQSLEGLKHTPISPASTPLLEQLRSRKT